MAQSSNGSQGQSQAVEKKDKVQYVDSGWPVTSPGEHAVTEVIAHVSGGLSPYGDTPMPEDSAILPYVHPYTRVNK